MTLINERDAASAPAARAQAAIELRGVTKTFGDGPNEIVALADVDLTVPAGQFVTVMGPSGCGKSTLLHVIGALEPVTAGVITLDGLDVAGLDVDERATLRRKRVGFVFQSLNLVPSLSAVENVMLPLELDGASPRQARSAAVAVLANVGLEQDLDRAPDQFSGGQRQRIAIARALVGERRVILADEPTGALDTATADSVVELLAGLSNDAGITVVMVTHEPRFSAWADRTVFLRDGRVVGDTDDTSSSSAGVL